jgi:catechol 2,3-dioxygenase-like lactoylglutathione lyase family enzyme
VLDHVGVHVSDFEQSKRFYEQALSPLGYELIMEPSVSAAGFGRWGKPDFWISQGRARSGYEWAPRGEIGVKNDRPFFLIAFVLVLLRCL